MKPHLRRKVAPSSISGIRLNHTRYAIYLSANKSSKERALDRCGCARSCRNAQRRNSHVSLGGYPRIRVEWTCEETEPAFLRHRFSLGMLAVKNQTAWNLKGRGVNNPRGRSRSCGRRSKEESRSSPAAGTQNHESSSSAVPASLWLIGLAFGSPACFVCFCQHGPRCRDGHYLPASAVPSLRAPACLLTLPGGGQRAAAQYLCCLPTGRRRLICGESARPGATPNPKQYRLSGKAAHGRNDPWLCLRTGSCLAASRR
jgi:hypothetical protein